MYGVCPRRLESLVATIRPSLVLLVRPPAAANAHRAAGTWADSLSDVEARQAYELRALDSLGDDAPQVRLCSGDADEACELIFDFLCSDVDPPGGGGSGGGGPFGALYGDCSDCESDDEYDYDDEYLKQRPKELS